MKKKLLKSLMDEFEQDSINAILTASRKWHDAVYQKRKAILEAEIRELESKLQHD